MNRFWLLITWLFIPPFFFVISKRFGFKTWERWVLTIFSSWGFLAFFLFIILLFIYLNSRPLDFDDVKFNTPEKVAEELGFKDLPKFSYVGNTVNAEFNWDYWDCLVEFQFENTLSVRDKEKIIQYAKGKDKFQWNHEELPKDGVIEFFNIKYSKTDTIPYNVVVTNDKVYVAYDNKLIYPNFSYLFGMNEFHLIAEITNYVGDDSSNKYYIKFNKPYSIYIENIRKDKLWKYKETSKTITLIKFLYSENDSAPIAEEYKIFIDKKQNTAIIECGNF